MSISRDSIASNYVLTNGSPDAESVVLSATNVDYYVWSFNCIQRHVYLIDIHTKQASGGNIVIRDVV